MGGLELATAEFKFRYVVNGNVEGLFSTFGLGAGRGAVGPEGLRLGDYLVPYEAIRDTTTRDDRVLFALNPAVEAFPGGLTTKLQEHLLVLHVHGNGKFDLERRVDRYCSVLEAQRSRQALESEGRGHLYRTARCPACSCVADLSRLPEAPYSYCRYCETVFGQDLSRALASNSYRTCDQCGYYDRVQVYTEFYFYFLILFWGVRHRRQHMCDACATAMATKLLLANAIFVLGVPNAVLCGLRAHLGRDLDLSSLAKANRAARRGSLARADQLYDEVLRRFPDHPGVRYNQALSSLAARDIEGGIACLRLCLGACPDYLPALRLAEQWTASP